MAYKNLLETKEKPPVVGLITEDEEEREERAENNEYVADKYSKFLTMYTAWNMRLPILGGRKPIEFWNDSVRDYAVLAAQLDDPNDPVEQYQTTLSRDQTNILYANLASKFFRPSCVAQNTEQSIDRTLGKVGDAVLEWAFKQDGWPSESGQQKTARIIHKCCVEGTAYSLDVVTEEGLDSQLIPNEEVFYPNLWQPNIQLQGRVYRARLNMSVPEAEEEFGDFENWKFVDTTGGWTSAFIIQYPELKGIFDGIVQSDKVSVLYIWERATQKQLKELKAAGKVNKNAKRAWYYNVIVNNVAMFDEDNVCPYKSGILPISKMIFEPMAKTEFALGNSVPNKCQEDKRWADAWKTNLRWRGKLAAMPPQLVIGGHLNGEEVMLPAVFSSLPKDVEVKAVPGVQPITSADIQLMNMAETDIKRSTVEQSPVGNAAARTAMIQQANAQLMIEPFSQQLAYFAASRSFHIITALFQLLPKSKLKMIAVPDQTLDDGLTGTFEIVFQNPEDVMTTEVDSKKLKEELKKIKAMGYEVKEEELRRLMVSFSLRDKSKRSRTSGNPADRVFIDPAYCENAKWYIFSDAADGMQDKDAMAQAKMKEDLPLLLQFGIPEKVIREYARLRGYPVSMFPDGSQGQAMAGQQPQGGMPQGQPGVAAQEMQGGALGNPPTNPNQVAQEAAAAAGVPPVGKLAGV